MHEQLKKQYSDLFCYQQGLIRQLSYNNKNTYEVIITHILNATFCFCTYATRL